MISFLIYVLIGAVAILPLAYRMVQEAQRGSYGGLDGVEVVMFAFFAVLAVLAWPLALPGMGVYMLFQRAVKKAEDE